MNDAALAAADLRGDPVTDTVTGAYSRALLQRRLEEELARSARTTGSCAVFLFDIDFFKTVNDAYGHQRGDEVLRQLSDRVRGLVRSYDVLFRYGGDEFVLLLPDTDRADAVQAALHVAAGVRDTEFPGSPPLNLSVSLGVSVFPDDGTDSDALLAVADRRNYLAKRRGRACAVADDVDTGTADAGSSRLWERDSALAAVQDFATRLQLAGRGALRVAGEPGAGHTRFLTEVATIATMRGLRVVRVVPGVPIPTARDEGGVLLVADTDAGPQAISAALRAAGPDVQLGLVYASTDGAEETEPPLPLLATAHLTPWTPATLGVWLRNTLRAEPSRTLVNWLYRSSGGLPGPATRELTRLRGRGGLVPTDGGGWTVAPALLGRTRHRSSLPTPMTRLVGRIEESQQVARLMATGRLVTLAGPGGIGKTRLALAVASAVADDFDDGAVYIPLAETTTPEGVVGAIAQALRVPHIPGVELLDEVIRALADRTTLLVLDNFEQVVAGAPILSQVLGAADGVSMLVTSRERLRLYGEQVYQVPPLAAPDGSELRRDGVDPAEMVARWPALALFEQRARAVDAGYVLSREDLPAVAELCARLDCMPLAIELTAAWIQQWSAAELLERIRVHLDGLGPGPADVPERQQTLRGAVDWSFRLLSDADRRLFTELGAFVDGCTTGGVLAVLDRMELPDAGPTPPARDADEHAGRRAEIAERLNALADKSLLVSWTDGQGWLRWRMLEVVRSYAVEQLRVSPDEPAVRRAHAAHYVDFTERLGVALVGPEQANWSGRMEREQGNVRTAFAWAMHHRDWAAAARLCLGLWRYWRNGHAIGEGRDWLGRVLAELSAPSADDAQPGSDRVAALLYAAAVLAGQQGDHEVGYALAADSLARALQAGDRAAEAQAHNALGIAASSRGNYPLAADHFKQSLAIYGDEDPRTPMALGNLANVSLRLGEVAAADGYAERCLALERAAGNIHGIALSLECVGQVRLARGDVVAARTAITEGLALSRELGDAFGEAMALHQLGDCARAEGDRARALNLCTAALARRHELGDREDLAVSLDSVAELCAQEDPAFASRLLGAVDDLRERHRLAPAPDQARRAATEQTVRDALGVKDFGDAYRTGRQTPVDLLVDEALDRWPGEAQPR